jgi:ABC-2 type transport system permease protein
MTAVTTPPNREPRPGPVMFSPGYVLIDIRRSLRNRRTLIFLTVMPVLFFLAFGGGYRTSNPEAFVYVMVSMAVYGAMTTTTAAGAAVSMERSLGWTRQLRLTPLRPAGYVLGKVIGALVLGVVPVALVLGTGAVLGAQLTASQWAECAVAAWACSLVFAAFGLFMGYLIPAENVMQFIGPLLAVLSFFGGLLTPLSLLPDVLQRIAVYMPTYPVGEVARSPIMHEGFTAGHLALLLAWTAAFALGTAALFRRDTARV